MIAQVTQQPVAASLIAILFAAAITDNILLTRFLGMCSFLSVSRQMKSALGLGLAVVFVTAATTAINSVLYRQVLIPLENAYGVPADTMILILFIVVIAAFVQLMEMFIERVSLGLYFSLGIFLPLITVNCAILGSSLFMVTRQLDLLGSLIFGLGNGLGWWLAIMLMAGIRTRLRNARIPPALDGAGITLIIAGIMALAFMGYSGMIQVQ